MRYFSHIARLIIVLLMLGVVMYAWQYERHHIEITSLDIATPQWQGREVRLAVLADLHAGEGDEAYLRKVVAKTLAEKPDAVLLLGDYVNHRNSSMSLDELADILQPLTALPCYAVLGNHDYYYGSGYIKKLFRQLGIKLMEHRCEQLIVEGHPLAFAGIRCRFTFRSPGKIAQPKKGVPVIYLTHAPQAARHTPPGALITLAGHTHGGQVCHPGGRALVLPDGAIQKDQASGDQIIGGHRVYISRGIGTSVLPFRLFCRPELLVLTIRSA